MTTQEALTVNMDPQLITDVTGTAGLSLLDCEECLEDSDAKVYNRHPEHQWCVGLHCRQYPTHPLWWVCTTCTNQRKVMKDASQLQRHNRIHHEGRIKNKKARTSVPLEEEEVSMDEFHMESELPDQVPDTLSALSTRTLGFTREASTNFFENEQKGLGAAYLVGFSTFALKDVAHHLDKDEVELGILVASLASTLSRGERAKLSLCFAKLVSVTSKSMSMLTKSPTTSPGNMSLYMPEVKWPVTVPTSPSLMRSRVMEGNHAILTNLPHPPVKWVGTDHAYVSLRDVVSDFLAHGTPYEKIGSPPNKGEGVRTAGQSRQAQEILERAKLLHGNHPVVVLLLKRWRDDFQVLKSNKGQKKGTAAWIGTITISPPHGMKAKSLRNTYPIALGPKGADHEGVEEMFLEELQKLSSGSEQLFFDKASNRMTRVHAELFVSLADQPERRGTCYVQLGNSTYHPRFGFCCDIGALEDRIRACNRCFKHLLEMPEDAPFVVPECNKCTCWETTSDLGILDMIPPKEYPPDLIPPSGKIRPYQLTFQSLLDAVETAHREVATGSWKKAETAKTYLRLNCLSGQAIDAVIEHAQNANTLRMLEGSMQDHPEAFEAITAQRSASPASFVMWKTPSLWTSGIDFELQIEATMHLLSGIIKAQTRAIQHWAACQNKKQSFLRYASGLLDPIQDLQLEWCKCPSYTGGMLPGWVSENYMGLARVAKWFYSGLPILATDEVFEEPIDLPQSKWLKEHNVGWLQVRGLNVSGSALEVKERVHGYLHQEGGPPVILPPSGASVQETMKLIRALSNTIARLMSACVTDSQLGDIERSIKIYLNRFCCFDELVYPQGPNKKASWLAKYNFSCFLNLVEVIRRCGPLRNLWEGGYQGEGYLRKTKGTLSNGLRKNWQVNSMERMLESTALDVITDRTCTDLKRFEERTTCLSDCYIYTGIGMLHRKYTEGVPLSVVILKDNTFGCLLRNFDLQQPEEELQYRFVEMNRVEHDSRINGLDYSRWVFDLQSHVIRFIDVDYMQGFCILLPHIVVDGESATFAKDGLYALITSEWEEMLEDGSIGQQPVVSPEDQ